LLSLVVALDGDGTTTYMITCAAMLPLYKRIGMNPMILATIAMLSLSIMSGMTLGEGLRLVRSQRWAWMPAPTSSRCCRP
jgi:Mg2+/citrate symporter